MSIVPRDATLPHATAASSKQSLKSLLDDMISDKDSRSLHTVGSKYSVLLLPLYYVYTAVQHSGSRIYYTMCILLEEGCAQMNTIIRFSVIIGFQLWSQSCTGMLRRRQAGPFEEKQMPG